ncbi:MAG: M43 family zinc metalloprotease, partial [Flavobacteriia bacterium]
MNSFLRFQLLMLCIGINFLSQGQIVSKNIQNQNLVAPQEKCGFDVHHQDKMLNDPIYRQNTLDFEQMLRNSYVEKAAATYVIPCVVHVISEGTALTSISDQQIKDAINGLNERLRKVVGSAGDGSGVDTQIEYALAVRDPSGNCTNGITRTDMTTVAPASIGLTAAEVTSYRTNGVRSATSGITDAKLKGIISWDKTKYYNIWLISEIDNNNGGAGIQGYAFFASSHGTAVDGAVMLVNSVKDPNATTFIHELGHSLNLYHTFEGDGTGATCPTNTTCATQGDLCCDTPPHRRSTSNCVTADNPCTAAVNATESLAHIKNYLDYSSDACQNMLTADQRTRMQAAITGPRASFIAATNLALVPVAASVVDFKASKTILCGTGNIVKFYDLTSCIPNTYMDETSWAGVSFSWSITNGTTTYTSTLQNPSITFNVTGTFDVTLTVTSSLGTYTLTKSGLVVVSSAPITGTTHSCTPSSTNAANYGQTVSNVTFNTINKSTSTSINTAYSNFTCTDNTIVDAGSTYTLSVTINAGGSGAEFVEVWLDYNNNGVIEAGETVMASTSTAVNTSSVKTASITIPGTAVQNTLLRMRVMAETSNAPSAGKKSCGTAYFIGEVEDYGVYIKSACGVISGVTANSRCGAGTVVLGATASAGTINWYSASTGGASLGSGTSYTTPSISTNTTYYVDATLSGCTSPTRTAVLASVLSTPGLSTLSSPTDAATGISSSPSFSWSAIAGASSYDIQIATDAGFTSIISTTNVATNAFTVGSALNISTTYYWRVRAINSCGTGSYTTPFSFTTSNISCNTFASSDVPKTIVDGATVTSTMNIASGVTITDVNVLNLVGTHTWINDMIVKLRSPSGTEITLFSNVCNDQDNFNLNFDDAAGSGVLPCPPTGGGTYIPSQSLSAFNGQNSAGTWTLTVQDVATPDAGAVTSWSLQICGSACTPVTPSVSISSSDADNTICTSTSVTFTATPTNGGTTPAYQWKLNGTNVGTNSTTYMNSGLANGDVVTCVLTSNAACASPTTATSAGITTTVNTNLTPSVSISSSDADNTICASTSVTFTATPTNGGTTPAYQWKLNGTNVGTNSTTYTNAALANGDVVTCVLTSNETCLTTTAATSSGITTTVNTNLTPSVSISSSDADNTICASTSVTFTATPTNGGTTPAYQWKLNGTNVGTNSTTYTNTALANGDVVTCVLTSNAVCASPTTATSAGITTTVNTNLTPSVSISSSDVDNTICASTSVTFTATPTNGGTTPAYQWKLNGTNVGTNSTTYMNSGLANGDVVTCVLTSNETCLTTTTATSAGITTTVSVPAISQGTTVNPSACLAADGSIEITGTGSGDLSWTGTASGSLTSTTLPAIAT